jgi:hypothetical protein
METEVVIGLGRDPIVLSEDLETELMSGSSHLELLGNKVVSVCFGDQVNFIAMLIAKRNLAEQAIVDMEVGSNMRKNRQGLVARYYLAVKEAFPIGFNASLALFDVLKRAQSLPLIPGFDIVRDTDFLGSEPSLLLPENPTFSHYLESMKQQACLTARYSNMFPSVAADAREILFFPRAFDSGSQFALQCLAARHAFLASKMGFSLPSDAEIRNGIPELRH